MSYFVIFMSAHIKPDSISTYLSRICNHLENFFPNICEVRNSPIVSCTLKGCKRLKGSEVKCKSPLSHDDIRHAISTLGLSSDYDDCLFLALLITGYAFFLPAHKANTAFEENKVIIPTNDDPTFNPLPITGSGSVPMCIWFMKRLWKLFPDKKIAGQSMHAGSATDLAEQGVLLYLIQAHRHWSSSAFKIYI
ncbi:hypothetical protein ARMGADRAFT_1048865 [Armillaria gallica]|uniref:Uncharacterized protein n=1 Tax=Armillaria gallica TaxID=47427 RepID=A0A2H3CWH2_ARMGA|nr:hypothetical protein ARMGADRAFT_1048865 [Armillaria gallica]